jgi:virginiamycin B lyase
MWFTTSKSVDSITPDGTVTVHSVPVTHLPYGITRGSDGNIWFTVLNPGEIGWVTPGTTGPAHECPDTNANPSPVHEQIPWNLAAGTAQQLYVADASDVVKMSTSCALLGTFQLVNSGAQSIALGITVAPNGNVWYTERDIDRIVSIAPNGTRLLSLAVPKSQTAGCTKAQPGQITTDPAGNAWFANECDLSVGRISPTGAITRFGFSGSFSGDWAGGIAYGPDGNIWLSVGFDGVARMTPSGSYRGYGPGTTNDLNAADIAVGADGNLWFTNSNGSIGRFVW